MGQVRKQASSNKQRDADYASKHNRKQIDRPENVVNDNAHYERSTDQYRWEDENGGGVRCLRHSARDVA